MPWPIPTAAAIAERQAAEMEAGVLGIRPELDPLAVSRAVRSEKGLLAVVGRAQALVARGTHAHLSWWGDQYFPDTADVEFIERHASIWGIVRRAEARAIGDVTVTATAAVTVPAGTLLRAGDALYATTAAVTIAAPGSGTLRAEALDAGAAANRAAGVALAFVEPQPLIQPGSAVVAAGGLAGGADRETDVSLTVRLLAHIAERPHGGAGFDYPTWVRNVVDARDVHVLPDWIGRGSVGVVVAIRDGSDARAPNAAELDRIADHLGRPGSQLGVRPVTAHVVVLAAVITAVDATLAVDPDTTAVRAAADAAFRAFVRRDAEIEGTIHPSRLSEAVSAAHGEYRHILSAPAAKIVLGPTAFPVPGVITWQAPS